MKKTKRKCEDCGKPCRGPRGVAWVKLIKCHQCRKVHRRLQVRDAVRRCRVKQKAAS